MINIIKGTQPASWKKHSETPGASYAATPELREALIKEQGYICAFCMSRIKYDTNSTPTHNTKIAHIKSQAVFSALSMNYSNLVICCQGKILGETHCDESQGSYSLTLNLFNNTIEQSISYISSDGSIKSSNTVWNDEIQNILNLNAKTLKANRFEVIEAVIAVIDKRSRNPNFSWTRAEIQQELTKWQNKNSDGKLPPFCGIVIQFLKKKYK